jgi:predicted secreted hydrolase
MKSSLLLLAGLLSAAAPYRLALPGYPFEFPRDHFNHPDFQTEWWYYTGNLRAADGHRFGFELTFFRRAVARNPADFSPWKLDDVYVAHLALSDITGQRFYHASRLNRPGPGFAGAALRDALVWNGNWSARWTLPPPAGFSTVQSLRAFDADFSFNLGIESRKPPVIHGKRGVSQKAPGKGHASHYISFTRLDTNGVIEVGGKSYAVRGAAWMDHEFFTHQLDRGQAGWDWFSLQFDDNTELMLFRLRRKDGAIDPFSAGTFVDARGAARHLDQGDFSLEPGRTWKSEKTGAVYPLAWKIAVPSLSLRLDVTTPLDQQELTPQGGYTPVYWEGAVDVGGSRRGSGYLEMTGYAGSQGLTGL